ncbi:hypothetical protein B0H14DRAFT_28332 [Mycena olivaceomarginata]|nr:hypothetical protein B0H14DRAFT_28332 [Mycena olivaceomarginata]
MNHPYSGAASYIYANEHPYTPVDPRPKDPYGGLPSFVPVSHDRPVIRVHDIHFYSLQSPSSGASSPRRSHDSGWSTEGTYTRTQRPQLDRRGLSSFSVPRIPLRTPISHPYQQRTARSTELAYGYPQTRSASLPGSTRPPLKVVTAPTPAASTAYIHPQARSASLPGHSREQAPKTVRMRMTPYERDGDPLSLRRSAFVPSSPVETERMSWQRKVQVRFKVRRRIHRAIERLRRMMRFKL